MNAYVWFPERETAIVVLASNVEEAKRRVIEQVPLPYPEHHYWPDISYYIDSEPFVVEPDKARWLD